MNKLFLTILIVFYNLSIISIPTLKITDVVDNQNKLSTENLAELSSNIREALTKTGKFKIIDADSKVQAEDKVSKDTIESIQNCNEVDQNNVTAKISSLAEDSVTKCIVKSPDNHELKTDTSDFYLVGLLNYFTKSQHISKIDQTSNNAVQSDVKISIIYKLVRLHDKQIMASIVTNGSAKEVSITPINELSSNQASFDFSELISTAEENLTSDLSAKLINQFNISIASEDKINDSTSNVVVYKE